MSGNSRVLIIDLDGGVREAIEELGGLSADEAKVVSASSIEEALAAIEKAEPSIVFFGLPQDGASAFALMERVVAAHPKLGVIAAAHSSSHDLVLNSMRAGADEFLPHPCSPEEFRSVVQRVCRKKGICRMAPGGGNGRVIAAFSGKGGCGKTMVAANLAFNIARLSRLPVAVADLDLQFGDMATMMDIQPRHTLAELVSDSGTFEEDLVYQVMIEHASGVSLLASPIDPADSERIAAEHVSAILKRLKEKYSYVILDTSCGFNECTLAALDGADDILLVTDTLVPSIQAAQRCIRVFDKLEYDRSKIRLVVNRFDPSGDVGEKELAKAFEVPVFAVLPNDFQTAMSAIDAGVPVAEVAERSELAAALRELAAKFVEGAELPQVADRKGLFGIFSRMLRK